LLSFFCGDLDHNRIAFTTRFVGLANDEIYAT